ncbi:MAG TPA: VOC family protein, partial [Allosphingosinicella sp.]
DREAEEAANFYVSILPDSRIDRVNRAPDDYPAGKKGDVLIVEFTLAGQSYTALNGGPYFQPNEAVSFQILCDDQAEVDRLWDALSAVPEAEQCSWLKDKYGFSWQIVPKRMNELLSDPDPERARRAFIAMTNMKKLDIAALEAAADGA